MGERLPVETWHAVARRDRDCQASAYGFGSTAACNGRLVVHHRRRRSQGVDHDLSNLVLLCDLHHREVHDYPTRAYYAGLMLRTGVAPSRDEG